MLRKELRIGISADTSGFDKTVEDMQRKLRDIYSNQGSNRGDIATQERLAKAGYGSMPTEPQKRQADIREKQNQRDLDKHIKDQVAAQSEMNRKLAEKLELLKKIESSEKAGFEYTNRSKKVQEDISKLKGNIAQNQGSINEALSLQEANAPHGWDRVKNGFSRGGFGGGARAFSREAMQNPSFGISAVGGIMSGAGSAMIAGGQMYKDYGAMPREIALAQGSSAQNGSSDLRNLFNGRASFENVFNDERSKSHKMAEDEKKSSITGDKTMAIGSILLVAGGIAATVLSGGAALPIMAGIAAAGSGAAGIYSVGSSLAPSSTRMGEKYDAQKEAETRANEMQIYEAKKRLNPLKDNAVQYYEQNYQRDLGLQRQFGLSDKQLYGDDFFGNTGDFTRDQHIQMAQGIASAGGSTKGSIGLAQKANKLSRDFDMTNSAQVLGTLSGAMNNGASANAAMKFFSEAMRTGLDTSEMRKFVQISADMSVKAGARSDTDAGMISKRYSDFIMENTQRGIDVASSTAGLVSGKEKQTSGVGASREMVDLMSHPKFSNLDQDTALGISSMDANQIQALNGPMLDAALAQTGMSESEFKSEAIKVKNNKRTNYNSTDSKSQKVKDMLQNQFGGDLDAAKKDKDFSAAFGRLGWASGLEGAGDPEQMMSFAKGTLGLNADRGLSAAGGFVAENGLSRTADQINKNQATGEQAINPVITNMLGEFKRVSGSMADFADGVVRIMTDFEAKAKNLDPAALNRLQTATSSKIEDLRNRTGIQPTAGKPK